MIQPYTKKISHLMTHAQLKEVPKSQKFEEKYVNYSVS